jgi:hypothetical protein
LEIERPGASLRQLLDELDTAREDALTDLLAIGDAELRAPSSWNDIEIDVRFLLMRFAHHEREHIDQILKWRVACNRPASEAERLLGRVWEQSGALEGLLIAVSDDVLDRKIDGHWTIRRILAHIRSAENYFRRLILRAVETPAKPVAV